MSHLESMGGLVAQVLKNLGIERLDVMFSLAGEWETITPEPWCSHATPVLLKDGELVVEAASSQTVGLLRYAVGDLLRSLDERFGVGVVGTVRVQSPPPSGRLA
ncbi:MAG: DciA family protein [Acidimicrobiia bacterium]